MTAADLSVTMIGPGHWAASKGPRMSRPQKLRQGSQFRPACWRSLP